MINIESSKRKGAGNFSERKTTGGHSKADIIDQYF